jgi:hypothetical protein
LFITASGEDHDYLSDSFLDTGYQTVESSFIFPLDDSNVMVFSLRLGETRSSTMRRKRQSE